MITFTIAVFLLLITPGPGVLSVAGMGAAYGFRPALRYYVGLWIGTNTVALIVVSGLAAFILSNPILRNLMLVFSTGYLLYLAFKIAFSGSKISFMTTGNNPGVVSGIILQLFNPKAYAVNTTLFAGFAFHFEMLWVETSLKFLIVNLIWIPIHLLWLAAGVSLERLDLAPKVQFRINLAMAVAMLAVVILAGTSIF